MPIRAVVFDRDGVLTHFHVAAATTFFRPLLPITVFAVVHRWQAWCDQHGAPSSISQEEDQLAAFWNGLADEFSLSPVQRARLLQVDYARFVVAYPDAMIALNWLSHQNLLVGVLSNFTLASLSRSLEAANLARWIDAACAATVIGASKPDPAAYNAILEVLGVNADETLFFDDEMECVLGARSLGMHSFHVDRSLDRHHFPGEDRCGSQCCSRTCRVCRHRPVDRYLHRSASPRESVCARPTCCPEPLPASQGLSVCVWWTPTATMVVDTAQNLWIATRQGVPSAQTVYRRDE